jgi:UrcA family protein
MWLLAPTAAGASKLPITGVHTPGGLMLAACIAALISGAVVAQARAEDHVVIETGVVKTSDLNLATARGARVLLRRVTAKAADLCTQTASPLARGAHKSWRECFAKAVATSIAPIKAPLVTAEYARVFGKPASVVSSR